MIRLQIGLLAIAVVAGIVWFFIHESQTHNNPRNADYILDFTDDLVLEAPTVADITEHLNLKGDLWSSASVTFIVVTDQEFADRHTLDLPSEFKWSSQPRIRQVQIDQFERKIASVLNNILRQRQTHQQSAIYKQINRVAQQRMILGMTGDIHVYSNLAENTEKFSVYGNGRIQPIRFDPQFFANGLSKIESAQSDLTSKIVFHFKANSREESLWFASAVEGYKLLFPNAQMEISTK